MDNIGIRDPLDELADAQEKRRQPTRRTTPGGDNAGSLPRNAGDWDRIFGESGEKYFFGREPSLLAQTALRYWKILHGDERGPLLDFGCGEGRDAVFFAQKGFEVTAVDGSEVGLEKTNRLAQEAHVGMTRVLCDLRAYRLPASLPFLHANNCLQFLGGHCLPTLSALQQRTASGGFHAISVFTRDCVKEQDGLYRFDHHELKFFYRDWRIFSYLEQMIWSEPVQAYLSFAQIVAARP